MTDIVERLHIKTYCEEFPAGSRVVVRTTPAEGSDHDFNGREGTIVELERAGRSFIAVKFDRPPRYGKNPVLICPHNLRHKPR